MINRAQGRERKISSGEIRKGKTELCNVIAQFHGLFNVCKLQGKQILKIKVNFENHPCYTIPNYHKSVKMNLVKRQPLVAFTSSPMGVVALSDSVSCPHDE